MTDLSTIIADPKWLPHRYDAQGDRVQFVRLARADHRAVPFLANYQPPSAGDSVWVDGRLLREASIESGPVHFIFHSAFCRSTLLSTALDIPGAAMGYSEPGVLNDLAAAMGKGTGGAMVKPVLDLLSRPLAPGETVVLKPSNVVNRILPHMLAARPDARALLMYAKLRVFLHSIHKKGMAGRSWGRRLYLHLGEYTPLDLGMSQGALFEMTDLQCAGLAWLLHQRHFAILLLEGTGPRMRTLDSDVFNDHRATTLTQLAAFFGFGLEQGRAEDIAQGPVFARHAKHGDDFDQRIEREARAAAAPVIAEEVEMVAHWIEQIVPQTGLQIPVGNALF